MKKQKKNNFKMDPNHEGWPKKIYEPPCPDTIDKKALDKAIKKLFKKKQVK